MRAELQLCRDRFCIERCEPWSCLGKVSWQVPNPAPQTITVTATTACRCNPVISTATQPVPDVKVRVCSIGDPECRVELTTGRSDRDGRVKLTFSTQAQTPQAVYLEFHKDPEPSTARSWPDQLLLLNTPPLSYDFEVGEVLLDDTAELGLIAEDIGTSYDPERAFVKLKVSNCNLQRSSGISLAFGEQGEDTKLHALFDGSTWDAFAMNLPVPANRIAPVTARLSPDPETGPLVAAVSLVVRKGAVTLAPFVAPTP